MEGLASTSSRLFRRLRASPSSSSILQHLKVLHLRVSFSNLEINTLTTYMDVNFNKRLQTFISQQLYTQSLYVLVFNTHPINRISKVGAARENTISTG